MQRERALLGVRVTDPGPRLLRGDVGSAGAPDDIVMAHGGRTWTRRDWSRQPPAGDGFPAAVAAFMATLTPADAQVVAAIAHLAGVGVGSRVLVADARLEPFARLAAGALYLGSAVHALDQWSPAAARHAAAEGADVLLLTTAMAADLAAAAPECLGQAAAIVVLTSRRESALPVGALPDRTWMVDLKDLRLRTDISRPRPDGARPGSFWAWADYEPGRAALRDGGRSWSFGEVAELVADAADRLRRAGFEPGSSFTARTSGPLDVLVAHFAAIAVDGSVAVLDAAAPPADVARAEAAVAASHRIDLTPDAPPHVHHIGPGQATTARGVIVRTAGSTGAGRWILNQLAGQCEHHARTLAEFAQLVGGRPDRPHLVAGELHHGAFFSQALAHLNNGSELVALRRWRAHDAVRAGERDEVRSAFLTPRLVGELLGIDGGRRLLGGLDSLLYGGDACPPAWKRELAEVLPGRAHEYYGASEAVGTLRHGSDEAVPLDSVGRPFLGTRARIVDDDGTPVPPGCEGRVELWNPRGFVYAGAEDGEPDRRSGWVQPGDMGRQDPDGALFITGRDAAMLRAGGRKLHANEVENVLLEHPSVADAGVTVVDGPSLSFLVAFIKPLNGRAPAPKELRAHCAERLPAWKVPNRVRLVDAIPRTDAGKIDRRALAGSP